MDTAVLAWEGLDACTIRGKKPTCTNSFGYLCACACAGNLAGDLKSVFVGYQRAAQNAAQV